MLTDLSLLNDTMSENERSLIKSLITVNKPKYNNKVYYFQNLCAFDIETTSTYLNGEKFAYMYIWTLAIDDLIVHGRSWTTFVEFVDMLHHIFNTDINRVLTIWVHSLAFEFQFIKHYVEVEEVFALSENRPIYVLLKNGIKFRCSYIATNRSLQSLASYYKLPIKKLTGDLDYNLIRHQRTQITNQEMAYINNDVLIIIEWLKAELKKYDNLGKIENTATGRVRSEIRKMVYPRNNVRNANFYRTQIQRLRLDKDRYIFLRKAFLGGFTHGNFYKQGRILENVESQDLTSAYPAVMVLNMFPSDTGEFIYENCNDYYNEHSTFLYILDVELFDVTPEFLCEHIISKHKCDELKNAVDDNGRIVSARYIRLTVTNLDFENYKRFYNFKYNIKTLLRYEKNYLPTEYIKSILNFYKIKTSLKGVEECYEDYAKSKELLNGIYGDAVTDPLRDDILYDNSTHLWSTELPNLEKLDRYNESYKRYNYYAWGVFVTAYVRDIIFNAILRLGEDYVYSDTDSVKFVVRHDNKKFAEEYNASVLKKIKLSAKSNNISLSNYMPKTVKGEEKPIGYFDFDGKYDKFKFLQAKSYLTEDIKGYHLTCAGLSKSAIEYIKSKGDPFKFFDEYMKIPAEETGKHTHEYIDEYKCGYITDYCGHKEFVEAYSSVHLEPCEFTINGIDQLIDIFKNGKEVDEY